MRGAAKGFAFPFRTLWVRKGSHSEPPPPRPLPRKFLFFPHKNTPKAGVLAVKRVSFKRLHGKKEFRSEGSFPDAQFKRLHSRPSMAFSRPSSFSFRAPWVGALAPVYSLSLGSVPLGRAMA